MNDCLKYAFSVWVSKMLDESWNSEKRVGLCVLSANQQKLG